MLRVGRVALGPSSDGGSFAAGKREESKVTDDLDEDVEALKKQFPSIRIFYKHDRTAELSQVPERYNAWASSLRLSSGTALNLSSCARAMRSGELRLAHSNTFSRRCCPYSAPIS